MGTKPWIRPLFQIAALYDFLLGILFFIAFKPLFIWLNVTLPNHDGYIRFPALLVATFGVGFWLVSLNPERNRAIIKLGILLKLSYSGVVLYYRYFGVIPWPWVPFAWFDLVFLVLFVAALRNIPIARESGS